MDTNKHSNAISNLIAQLDAHRDGYGYFESNGKLYIYRHCDRFTYIVANTDRDGNTITYPNTGADVDGDFHANVRNLIDALTYRGTDANGNADRNG